MPTYTFENKKTGEQWTEFMTMSQREEVLEDKNIRQVPCAPLLHSGVGLGGGLPHDSGFNDLLIEMKKTHGGRNNHTGTTIHTH